MQTWNKTGIRRICIYVAPNIKQACSCGLGHHSEDISAMFLGGLASTSVITDIMFQELVCWCPIILILLAERFVPLNYLIWLIHADFQTMPLHWGQFTTRFQLTISDKMEIFTFLSGQWFVVSRLPFSPLLRVFLFHLQLYFYCSVLAFKFTGLFKQGKLDSVWPSSLVISVLVYQVKSDVRRMKGIPALVSMLDNPNKEVSLMFFPWIKFVVFGLCGVKVRFKGCSVFLT